MFTDQLYYLLPVHLHRSSVALDTALVPLYNQPDLNNQGQLLILSHLSIFATPVMVALYHEHRPCSDVETNCHFLGQSGDPSNISRIYSESTRYTLPCTRQVNILDNVTVNVITAYVTASEILAS